MKSDDELSLIDLIASDDNLVENLMLKEQKELLRKAISTLPEKEQFILNSFYAIDVNKMTLAQLAQTFNVSKQRIGNIIKKSRQTIKKIIRTNKVAQSKISNTGPIKTKEM